MPTFTPPNPIRTAPRPLAASSAAPRARRVWIIRFFAVLGLSLAAYLAWAGIAETSVAGCGGATAVDCDAVLASRWAKWLTIPVGLLAVAAYASVLAAASFIGPRVPSTVSQLAWALLVALATLLAGAALWFVTLQVLVIQKLCPPCLASHAIGLILAGVIMSSGRAAVRALTPVAAGVAAVLVLVLGQAFVEPVEYRVTTVASAEPLAPPQQPDAKNDVPIEARRVDIPPPPKPSRKVTVLGGAVELDVYEQPHLGPPEAKHVLVELFDYTCPHCHDLHEQLSRVRPNFGDDLVIVLVPVPLDLLCNKYAFPARGGRHQHACAYAKLALAAWRADPAAFPVLHERWMSAKTLPDPAEMREEIARAVGSEKLSAQTAFDADTAIAFAISRATEIYNKVSTFNAAADGAIPKLLTANQIIDGRFASDRQLLEALEKVGIRPNQPQAR
jgi:uncharacterized membrane protein